jgi:hypothetical protein
MAAAGASGNSSSSAGSSRWQQRGLLALTGLLQTSLLGTGLLLLLRQKRVLQQQQQQVLLVSRRHLLLVLQQLLQVMMQQLQGRSFHRRLLQLLQLLRAAVTQPRVRQNLAVHHSSSSVARRISLQQRALQLAGLLLLMQVLLQSRSQLLCASGPLQPLLLVL